MVLMEWFLVMFFGAVGRVAASILAREAICEKAIVLCGDSLPVLFFFRVSFLLLRV